MSIIIGGKFFIIVEIISIDFINIIIGINMSIIIGSKFFSYIIFGIFIRINKSITLFINIEFILFLFILIICVNYK